ncbi:bifunctional diaminohydroxyphosphoribosylaminopyrimidine deaminase/5-amino-6-(5-phosphoribosylamino)uracil reductase RibD [Mesonia maritima]|uniref:Riboflavin biosynthesis protein RibD n=1 Tax=Mesonia maritima TaxID=1793873 RepID=A0ABU1K4V1_9FLAO|nr:bifunctional diaminohydroxyphosphoribosylaminopyrimidine deaminase/5-amino-6-(5-phosphoribosylamino)uracil reductase RibD [Mesonia maritima]MDR6300336.1 diaminohydroxyphosphoribosylaminopyrimidine deaminase/5-amino-6-(5-phosphoribosylamino)uracil reductase [Mesonia maritima]
MKIHEKYINRCIQLAKNAEGKTYPNPLVGSVLVYKNEIIGEGWHQKAGKPHAEVNAIHSVEDKKLLKKATIYVSLEPCSHFGKTPPCSDLIIEKGIKKVVIGTMDPFAKVAGRGIQKLMNAGCEVVLGVLEKECQELNKRFFTFHKKKRPYIILKWAQTKDGFIAPLQQNERKPVWISNEKSKQLVHKWRSEEQAILVGTNTAIKDNPKLNTRLVEGENPTRIVIDRNLKIPKNSHLFDGKISTFVFTENSSSKNQENLTFIPINFEENVPQQICDHLYQKEFQSVIIEGGQQTLQSFIDKNLWDEARVFTGSVFLEEGIKAPTFVGNKIASEEIGDNNLSIYKND